jgi:hypothetical protein
MVMNVLKNSFFLIKKLINVAREELVHKIKDSLYVSIVVFYLIQQLFALQN